jgi:c-di-GMP-binding flagellar brake protein YcgR
LKELEIDSAVDIVLDTGAIKESFVLDVKKETIVLLQTFPPLDRSFLNKHILITYVTQDRNCERYGFSAEVAELQEGYETKGRGVPVIIASRMGGEKKCELRMHPRVNPPATCKVFLDREELRVVDISAGGIHVIQKPGKSLSAGVNDVTTLDIEINSDSVQVDARILRKWNIKGMNGPEHLALKFLEEIPFHTLIDSNNKGKHSQRN